MKYQYKEMPESMKGTYGRCFLSQHINLTGSQMLRCSPGQGLRVRIMEADIT